MRAAVWEEFWPPGAIEEDSHDQAADQEEMTFQFPLPQLGKMNRDTRSLNSRLEIEKSMLEGNTFDPANTEGILSTRLEPGAS